MKKEFGKWILDITKYLLTVGILAPALKFGDETALLYYVILFFIVVVMAVFGFYLIYAEGKKESNKVKNSKNHKKR